MAFLDLTIISASISPDLQLDLEPKEIYSIIQCAQEQRRTKTTHDHGRTPVWNETFEFDFGDQDVPKFIFVQMFATRSVTDELLGVARIPISTTGEIEGSLHVLVSPDKGETGKLKAAWRWKSIPQQRRSLSSSPVHDVAKDKRDHSSGWYPPAESTYDEVTSAMAKLAFHQGQDKEPYPSTAYGSAPYPPNYEAGERSSVSLEPYAPPNELSNTEYPPSSPYPPITDAYPPYPHYQKTSSSSEESHFSFEKEEEKSYSSTSRGLGDTKDKGHHSHMPYGYAPPAAYGGGYPPPPGYPSPYGPPAAAYPPAPGYPPAPPYPPAPHNAPPAPYGYAPSFNPYPQQPYPLYGYPPQASYPVHPGYGSYAPGMYVGHSSHGKHSKHHKMPKHSMYHYGHAQPHYGHYKHKKHKHKKFKGFGKGYKFKKFKF